MELRDYLVAVRRRWWVIVAAVLAGAVFAWLTAPGATADRRRLFEAVHTLTVEPEARVFTPENPETIAILATSGELPIRVAERVGETPGDLLGKVDVVGDGSLAVVVITAHDADPTHAEELADGYALTLVAHLDEQEQLAQDDAINRARDRADELDAQSRAADAALAADPENDVLREQRDALLRQFSGAYERYNALLAEPRADSGLKSLGPALAIEIDAGISAPRSRAQRVAILGAIGLLLGLAAAIVLQRVDTRLASKEEAEAAFGLPVIAEIPLLPYRRRRLREVISFAEPASPIAEAYRVLRTTMMILAPVPLPPVTTGVPTPQRRRATDVADSPAPAARTGSELRVFLVTSTRPSEGKTTTVVNLAAGFAEAGRSVLIVGADIRRPEMHHFLGVHRDPGLTDVLRGGPSARTLEQVIVQTAIPGVRVVPSGPTVINPGELLLEAPALLAQARELADIVLVDSTPMLTVNDAIQLMPGVDAVLVTSRTNRTTIPAARRAHELLARVRVPVCGVVLIGAPSTPGVSSYYYGYQTNLSTSPLARLARLARSRRGAKDRFGAPRATTRGPERERTAVPAPRPVPRQARRQAPTADRIEVLQPSSPADPARSPERSGSPEPTRSHADGEPAAAPGATSAPERAAPGDALPTTANGSSAHASREADPWGWP